MTNLFKRFFTHKSKFLLIIISLLGLAFSYSCSCRDNPYEPPPTPEGNGKINFATGEADGNTYLIRLSSSGDEKDKALIKFTNDDVNNVEIESIDSGTTGINFENADFSYTYSDGTLSLTEAGKNKLTEAGKSNAIKVSFKITTTSDKYKDETKTQTKKIDIAVGKSKALSAQSLAEQLKTSCKKDISINSGNTTFRFEQATVTSDGLQMKPPDESTDKDTLTASANTFINAVIEILADSYYNGGVLSSATLKGNPSTSGSPKKNMLEFSLDIKPDTFYELEGGFSSFKVSADFKFNNRGTEYTGEWQ